MTATASGVPVRSRSAPRIPPNRLRDVVPMSDAMLQSRIRGAELSIRTANLLCKKFGEDATFSDVRRVDHAVLKTYLGAKGMKELEEVLWTASQNDVGHPTPDVVKNLRDEFAIAALPALISRHRADVAWSDVAPLSYSIADAMLEARKV